MSIYHGKHCYFALGNGASPIETFTHIGSVELVELSIQNPQITRNTINSLEWRELADKAGRSSMRVSLEGVYADSAAEQALMQAALANALVNVRVTLPHGDTLSFATSIADYALTNAVGDVQNFVVTLESSGAVTLS